jgi:NAD+ diphosphatase
MLEPIFPEPEALPATARWVLVQGDGVLVSTGDCPSVLSDGHPGSRGIAAEHIRYLGYRGTIPVYAAGIPPGEPAPPGTMPSGVRDLFGRIPEEEVAIPAFAVQLIHFDRTARFCGRCGAKTRPVRTERSRFCTACNLIVYPRLSPAVIVLVRRGEEVLLARGPRSPPGMYSLIAGFVEAGENLEHAIAREVQEEIGLTVKNIRYFGSEPWPFPHSLMIGFVADYASGDIVVDGHEIEAASWFDRDHLPRIPENVSISRALIDWWRISGSSRGS